MSIKDHFDTHGWILLKDFFSKDEILKINKGVEESTKNNIKGDLLCNPYLRDLTVLNKKIIDVVRELIGQPTYIGDSSVSLDNIEMSLHKDRAREENLILRDVASEQKEKQDVHARMCKQLEF